MPSVRLPFRNIGDVDLHHWNADGTDAVGEGDGSVGVGSRVHDHGIILTVSLLQLVNQNAFVVRLEIGEFMFGEPLAEFWQVILKRDMTIDFGFAFA